MSPQLSASVVPLKVPFIKRVISVLKYPNNTKVPGSRCETQRTSLDISASKQALVFSSPQGGAGSPLADRAPEETVKVSCLKTAQHGSHVNASNF